MPKTDPEKVLSACRRLADLGYAFAQNNLGVMYDNGGNDAEAAKWFLKAADQGSSTAQENLGRLYEVGHGVPQSYVQAAKWYRKAADQGDVDAQYALGSVYHEGVPRDDVEAAKWFRKAANQGNADAQDMLGNMCEHGWGNRSGLCAGAHVVAPSRQTQANNSHYILAGFAIDDRDRLAGKMTPAQIEKAQALAAAWKPTAGQ